MNSLNKEEFERYYQEGKYAFECGRYSLSIEKLIEAQKYINSYSRVGGEVQMWLVNAYQAAGKLDEAIALCQELIIHPHPQIRQTSSNLLYIIKAPKLERPKEWMTEIPDFNLPSENTVKYKPVNKPKKIKSKPQIENIDLNQVNTKDNQFVWFALFFLLIIFVGVIYL